MPRMRRPRSGPPVAMALALVALVAGLCVAPPAAAEIAVQDNRFKGVQGFAKFDTMVTVRDSPPPPGAPAMRRN